LQRIGPFQDINFFIGPNNSGKSTVLNFLAHQLHSSKGPGQRKWLRNFGGLDIIEPAPMFLNLKTRFSSGLCRITVQIG
jgi:predicted ATPase